MGQKYASLDTLLAEDSQAKSFYSSLPDYVRESISQRGGNVNSFESLKDYAENLLHGDN